MLGIWKFGVTKDPIVALTWKTEVGIATHEIDMCYCSDEAARKIGRVYGSSHCVDDDGKNVFEELMSMIDS